MKYDEFSSQSTVFLQLPEKVSYEKQVSTNTLGIQQFT